MSIADAIRRMHAAGLSVEQIAVAVEAFEVQPKQRSKAAERTARWRHKASQNVTVTASDDVTDTLPDKEKSPLHPSKETNPLPSLRSGDNPARETVRGELEAVLDSERAAAVIDHRKGLRKPLTAHAAKLLAGKLAKTGDANAAADAMIANGWQGFEPGWLDSRGTTQGRGPPASRNPFFAQLQPEIPDEPEHSPPPAEAHRAAAGRPGAATLDLQPNPVHPRQWRAG